MDLTITPNTAILGVIIIQQGAIMYLCYRDHKTTKRINRLNRLVMDIFVDIYRLELGLTTQASHTITDSVAAGDIIPDPSTVRIPRIEGSGAEAERLV